MPNENYATDLLSNNKIVLLANLKIQLNPSMSEIRNYLVANNEYTF